VASLNQPRICQALPVHRFDERVEPVKGVDFDIAFVEPEGELVNVVMQMLRAGVVVDAMHPALHHGPDAFDGVSYKSPTKAVLPNG
jgi:hypothetical protein